MTHAPNHLIASPAVGTTRASRLRPLITRSLAVTAIAGAMAGSLYAPASADSTEPQSVTANVEVGSVISLTGLPDDFTLVGLPGDLVSEAVPYNVETNNSVGYAVNVTAQAPALMPVGGSGDTIPIENLTVEDESGIRVAMNADTGITIDSNGARSVAGGDERTSDFEMLIPFVGSDTYSVGLTYIASTL